MVLIAGAVLLSASAASACPVCETETGKQVRAGIFGDDFASNVALTLVPFPLLAGLVALIHFGPWGKGGRAPSAAGSTDGQRD